VIFFDASAAAERYFQEAGSERMQDLWNRPEIRSSLALLRCELASVLNRKLREHALSRVVYQTSKDQMEGDLAKLNTVPADDNLIERSVPLLDAHPFRALDSLYLAGALSLQRLANTPVLFVSSDRQLCALRRSKG
jgi:predicted nucleic acid-binding protein